MKHNSDSHPDLKKKGNDRLGLKGKMTFFTFLCTLEVQALRNSFHPHAHLCAKIGAPHTFDNRNRCFENLDGASDCFTGQDDSGDLFFHESSIYVYNDP